MQGIRHIEAQPERPGGGQKGGIAQGLKDQCVTSGQMHRFSPDLGPSAIPEAVLWVRSTEVTPLFLGRFDKNPWNALAKGSVLEVLSVRMGPGG